MKSSIIHLFEQTKLIIKHKNDKALLRGETFNIFSILGLEHYENTTHSAFLGELLNPRGSHLKGNIFLKLFLEKLQVSFIDIETANVHLEYNIGTRNDEAKTGGRMDIYIEDAQSHALAIENKIYAYDQHRQLERYCNFKHTDTYKVFYLNLYGDAPSKESAGVLIPEQDYYIISYQTTIIEWLTCCHKESSDTPILRETIRQYILLLKKLTNTMEQSDEKELIELMFNYFEESSFIASNFAEAQHTITEDLRQQVITALKSILPEKFNVVPGATSNKVYSQIWITLKDKEKHGLQFGLESFSGKGFFNGGLFVGLFSNLNDGKHHPITLEHSIDNTKTSYWWIDQKQLPDFEGLPVNLSNSKLLLRLYKDEAFKKRLIDYIANQTVNYVEMKFGQIENYINK